jgi:hypothetical protein
MRDLNAGSCGEHVAIGFHLRDRLDCLHPIAEQLWRRIVVTSCVKLGADYIDRHDDAVTVRFPDGNRCYERIVVAVRHIIGLLPRNSKHPIL